jgi:HSP20 family protein
MAYFVQKAKDIKDEQVHRQELSVSLPAPVIGEGVKATYKNGLLEIRIPKRPEEPKKRINVDFH